MIGAIAGALLGLLVAWIVLDKEEEAAEAGSTAVARRPIKPNEVIALVLASVGVARQVATLRQR